MKTLMEYKEMVAPYVCDVSEFLHEALAEGKEILMEGQLALSKTLTTASTLWLRPLPRWLLTVP